MLPDTQQTICCGVVGLAEALLKMMLTAGVVTLGVGTFLFFHIGVVGMAIGTACGFGVGMLLLFRATSSRRFEVPMRELMSSTTRGLLVPFSLCAAIMWASTLLFPPHGLPGVALHAALGLAVYIISYFVLAASVTERRVIRSFVRSRLRMI